MLATVAAMLPAAAGVFALAVIVLSALRYAPLVLALRDELAACETTRELRFVVVTTQVRCDLPEVWRPGFRPLAAGRFVPHAPRRPALRAAA